MLPARARVRVNCCKAPPQDVQAMDTEGLLCLCALLIACTNGNSGRVGSGWVCPPPCIVFRTGSRVCPFDIRAIYASCGKYCRRWRRRQACALAVSPLHLNTFKCKVDYACAVARDERWCGACLRARERRACGRGFGVGGGELRRWDCCVGGAGSLCMFPNVYPPSIYGRIK